MASKFQTTFSQRIRDGLVHVEIGRDIAVPDGVWCSIDYKGQDKKFPQAKNLALPPRISARRATWLKFEATNSGEMIYVRAQSLAISKTGYPYATPLDTWSALQAGCFSSSNDSKAWMLPIEKDPSRRDSYLCNFATWLMRQPSDTIEMTIEALTELGAGAEVLAYLAICRAEEVDRRARRTENAKQKAAKTRVATAAKGENPERWKEGDMVVARNIQSFRSGGEHQVFWWVRSSYNPQMAAGCFLQVDENGLGVGPRYRARKSMLLKVCHAAFDIVEGISNHEKLRLLGIQRRIDAEREAAKKAAKEKAAPSRRQDAMEGAMDGVTGGD